VSASGHYLARAAAGSRGRRGAVVWAGRTTTATRRRRRRNLACASPSRRSLIPSARRAEADMGPIASGLEHAGRCRLELELVIRHVEGHSCVGAGAHGLHLLGQQFPEEGNRAGLRSSRLLGCVCSRSSMRVGRCRGPELSRLALSCVPPPQQVRVVGNFS
jgi:hypothetical protein